MPQPVMGGGDSVLVTTVTPSDDHMPDACMQRDDEAMLPLGVIRGGDCG